MNNSQVTKFRYLPTSKNQSTEGSNTRQPTEDPPTFKKIKFITNFTSPSNNPTRVSSPKGKVKTKTDASTGSVEKPGI